MSTVVTVLRSGGDFAPWHVQMMQRQVAKHAPSAEFVCLSDQPVQGVRCIQLEYDWPGWWAKLELFDPALGLGDFLYTDLDNIILGGLEDILSKPTMYTCQRGGWTALMHIPTQRHDPARIGLWDAFIESPEFYMGLYGNQSRFPYGDAGFINHWLGGPGSATWEDLVPGQVTNIVDAMTPMGPRRHLVTPTTRVLLFGGGKRRPWNLPGFRQLYGEDL